MSEDNRNDNQQTMALLNKPVFNFLRYPTTYVTLLAFAAAVADLGGAGGAAAPPLASFRKIQGLPILKIVRTAIFTLQLAPTKFS